MWEHCEKIFNASGKIESVKCNYCETSYKFGSTSTIKAHLSKKHSILLIPKEKENFSIGNANGSEDIIIENESDSETNLNETTIPDIFNKTDASGFSKNKLSSIRRTLLLFLITASLPFRIVENMYFMKLINLLCPFFTIPNRRSLAGPCLDETYEAIIFQIKNKVKLAKTITATTDLWTSIQKLPYIGITIHFYDDNFKFHNYTICIDHLTGSHNGSNLNEKLISKFEEWNIFENVRFIVTDNGKDICKAVSLSENVGHIRCMGHLLNLMVRKIIKKDKYEVKDAYSHFEDEDNEEDNDEQEAELIQETYLSSLNKENINEFQFLIKKMQENSACFSFIKQSRKT